EVAEFELENQLPDESLVGRDGQGAVDGELVVLHALNVLFPRVDVLVMNALEVREGGNAGADHVGAVPDGVAVDEAGVTLGLDEGIGAGDLVAGGLELLEGVVDPGALGGPRG